MVDSNGVRLLKGKSVEFSFLVALNRSTRHLGPMQDLQSQVEILERG